MRKLIRAIVIIPSMLMCFLIGADGNAETAAPLTAMMWSEGEQELFHLINEARRNPIGMAAILGMDIAQIRRNFPELSDVFAKGLPPLVPSFALTHAAQVHGDDLMAQNYFSSISADGKDVTDRVVESGYTPFAADEALGMLGYANYMEPKEAAGILFENLFRDELDPDRDHQFRILNSEFEDIGISLGSGTLRMGSTTFNAYITICDFGYSRATTLELELLELINVARKRPLSMAHRLGLSPSKVLSDLPEMKDILLNGMPPVIFEPKLYLAAHAHGLDILKNNYYSHESLDGQTAADRVAQLGYRADVVSEAMRLLSTVDYVDVRLGAWIHFIRLFKRELDPDCQERVILNPELTNGGVTIISSQPESDAPDVGQDYKQFFNILIIGNFASNQTNAQDSEPEGFEMISGRVFKDVDENGIYGIGEGLETIPVIISSDQISALIVYTNAAGGFYAKVPKGYYRVDVKVGDTSNSAFIETVSNNVQLDFKF